MAINDIFAGGPVSFSTALRHPVTIIRAIKVALIVGTILVAINHGDLILHGLFPPFWKLVLTYLVPYSVSSYSSAAFITELSAGMKPTQGKVTK